MLVIKDGEIIERGTHDPLLKAEGFYYNLYNSQFKKWDNDRGIMGEYEPIVQETQADLERQFGKLTFE